MEIIRTRLNTSLESHTAYHRSVMVSFIYRLQEYVPCTSQPNGLVPFLTRLPLTGLRCGSCVARAAAAWRIFAVAICGFKGHGSSYRRGRLVFISGRGQMWRRLQEKDMIVDAGPGLAVTIPVKINFQFRSVSHIP